MAKLWLLGISLRIHLGLLQNEMLKTMGIFTEVKSSQFHWEYAKFQKLYKFLNSTPGITAVAEI